MTVPLDPISTAELRNPNVNKKRKEFAIHYWCADNPNATLKLSSQNTINASQGIIGLTNANHHGVAKGVGIQLLHSNGNPVDLNQKISLGKIDSTSWRKFNMAAQYIHTSGSIIPGTTNATLTYELEYN
ncbi:fimbrial protein [Candidatus Regiella insecticola]|uniref:Fimbrial protein n=1 Tax=Candidatus Regiella insecticola TaxID=138073 RepID=A0A6L2ZPE5_9ENTR|nr:fimbrial protein [Candidatus Regiella insecticola]